MDGVVRNFNQIRGYGFITPVAAQTDVADVFFHKSALKGTDTAPIGCCVSFILVAGTDGRYQAADVEVQQANGSELYGEKWEDVFHE